VYSDQKFWFGLFDLIESFSVSPDGIRLRIDAGVRAVIQLCFAPFEDDGVGESLIRNI
jgi:hypothetical protein